MRRRTGHPFANALLAVVPVALTLALVVPTLDRGEEPVFPCPLYPTGVVAIAAALHERCPLEAFDQLRQVRVAGRRQWVTSHADLLPAGASGPFAVEVVRAARPPRTWRTVELIRVADDARLARFLGASILAAVLLTVVLDTVGRAPVESARPFSLIYSSIGVGLVAAVADWASLELYPASAWCRALLPAAVAHLSLVFPRPLEITRRIPQLCRAPYLLTGLVLAAELSAVVSQTPSTLILAQRLLATALGVAVAMLVGSCAVAARSSPSVLARRQGQAFLFATLGLAVVGVVALAVTRGDWLTAVTVVAALSPLPLGYSIARYHLVDLDASLRAVLGSLAYLMLWAAGLAFVISRFAEPLGVPDLLRPPPILFAGIYAMLLPADAVRRAIQEGVASAIRPRAREHFRRARESLFELSALRGVDAIARGICDVAARALPKRGIALFVRERREFRLAARRGPRAPVDARLADAIAARTDDEVLIDLNRLDIGDDPLLARAQAGGVDVIVRIRLARELHGVVVVSRCRRWQRMPTFAETDLLRYLAGQAASALAGARLLEALEVAERFAERGRMHAELAHEIGKPLGALEVIASRLEEHASDDPVLQRRLERVASLTAELRAVVQSVLAPEVPAAGDVALAEILAGARREVELVHGVHRVALHPLPETPRLAPSARRLRRVLNNLLDNALRAGRPAQGVEVRVRMLGATLEIRVVDDGPGLPPEQLERVFDPFVSLRPGGSGLGLPMSRQIVEELGGDLWLEPGPEGGLHAVIELPLDALTSGRSHALTQFDAPSRTGSKEDALEPR